jgi:hypothetical protein
MKPHDDFEFEPVRGLPATLPEGERLLWQGAPDWRLLARHAFHTHKVAVYFLLLAAWFGGTALYDGLGAGGAIARAFWFVIGGGAAVGILALLGFLYARSTVYSLTNRRLVFRSGLALPVTLNLPFSQIESASVAAIGAGRGNIALKVVHPNRIAFLVLWPNARPLHLRNPQPMLSCIENVDGVAAMLGQALAAELGAGARIARPAERPIETGAGMGAMA